MTTKEETKMPKSKDRATPETIPPKNPALRWMPVAALKPWDKNPRRNDEAVPAVARSIQQFGFLAPVVAWGTQRRIIAGHTRIKAVEFLRANRWDDERGDWTKRDTAEPWQDSEAPEPYMVPVRVTEFASEEDASAYAMADNRLGELADWDADAVSSLLKQLDQSDDFEDLTVIGWDADELRDLFGVGEPEEEPAAADDSVPELHAEVHSVAGEVYQLGPHRLICGSCRDPETVATLLDGREINVAFTSPPYASQRKYDESSGFKPIAPDDFSEWFDLVQSTVKANLAADGSWFVNIKAHCEDGQRSLYVIDLTLAHVREWGWRFVDEFCWKRKAPPGRWPNRLRNDWEPVYQFDIGGSSVRHSAIEYVSESVPTHGGDRSDHMEGHWNLSDTVAPGMAHRGNVLDVASGSHGGHPAGFPVGLPRFFIKAYSDEGDAIFDPFLGSGTTLIAAAELGRIGYGCEISPGYCDVIRRRWTAYAEKAGVDAGPGALAMAE